MHAIESKSISNDRTDDVLHQKCNTMLHKTFRSETR